MQAYHPCHITISDNKIYPAFQAIHQHISLGQKTQTYAMLHFKAAFLNLFPHQYPIWSHLISPAPPTIG